MVKVLFAVRRIRKLWFGIFEGGDEYRFLRVLEKMEVRDKDGAVSDHGDEPAERGAHRRACCVARLTSRHNGRLSAR